MHPNLSYAMQASWLNSTSKQLVELAHEGRPSSSLCRFSGTPRRSSSS